MSKGKQQAQGFDSTLPPPVFTDGLFILSSFFHGFKNPRLFNFPSSRRIIEQWAMSYEQWDMRCELTRIFHALLYREPFTPYVTNQKTHDSLLKADCSKCWGTVFLHVRVDYCFAGFVFEPQCLFYKILQRIVARQPYFLAETVAKHQDTSWSNGQ